MPVFQFDFTSTIDDLLKAEEAEKSFRFGRPLFRGSLVVLGGIFVFAGLITLVAQGPNWSGVIWLAVGLTILHFLVVKQIASRFRIKRSDPKRHLRVTFDDSEITIQVDQKEEYSRTWGELAQYIVAHDGIVFHFSDGVVNWLPARVFSSEHEREQFVNFLEQKY